MPARVVTIARTMGAGGEDVGRLVAQQLHFRHVDDEIIQGAADRAGVSAEAVERTEHRRPLLERVLAALANASSPEIGMVSTIPVPYTGSAPYEQFLTEVIRETAAGGDVVMVAHGSGMCLAGTPGVLRVLVTASPATRAARIAAAQKLDAKRAEKAVADSDQERADFFRRFYQVNRELDTHYDMVCNTDVLAATDVAKIVAAAAGG